MEPFASQIRPKDLSEFMGQSHLVGEGKPLSIAIKEKHLFSFILWGPPGVGKTTLARIYADSINADFTYLSAVSAGKDDIRALIEKSLDGPKRTSSFLGRPKVLFLDEIHRFNKSQQDFLLPYVESGELTLIGATTENPSFEVIAPLLSRCRVFILKELGEEEMSKIIDRAAVHLSKEYSKSGANGAGGVGVASGAEAARIKIAPKAKEWLVNMANGDARQAITMLENTAKLYKKITVESLKETLQNKYLRFDKKGEEHYNTISAFIKSMRASDPDAALYYMARMIESGEDPKFIARRMVIFASEDIGMALPTALVVANEVFQAVDTIGLPECGINLAHGVVYLSLAPKTKSAYYAYMAALEDAKKYGNLPIPLEIRNATTKLMKEIGYGKGYEKYSEKSLLPEKLKGKVYFKGNSKKRE